MKATDMISKITALMNTEKKVVANIYTRDANGSVVSVEIIPLNDVFAHDNKIVRLCFEKSNSITEER